MFYLEASIGGCDDLSIGSNRHLERRRKELTNKKTVVRRYLVKLVFRDVFSFPEWQGEATSGS